MMMMMIPYYLLLWFTLIVSFPLVKGRMLQTNDSRVFVPGIFDTANFLWGSDIFKFTVSLINDHSDGWFDEILNDGTVLEYEIADSACRATYAARAYWNLRTRHGGKPHGIVGCRCSSASIAVARIAGLEEVPQNSPTSTSARLSNTEEFPSFSRVISADATHALISMLRYFGWGRVTILATDTQYGKDQATEFRHLWKGDIAFSHTITLNPDGSINEDSVNQALNGVPTDDPANNSRIILLLAHDQHAYSILKIATERSFQPDTIWVGTESWVNRSPPDGDLSWLPEHPGYIGLTPYRNRNADYQDYLERLNAWHVQEGRVPWDDLPDYAAEYMVDSILSISMALSSVPREARLDGALVSAALRNLTFDGISGPVSFTEKGDRFDPRFTIFNLQRTNDGVSWVDVGVAERTVGDTMLHDGVKAMCFADVGCGLTTAPSDSYPVPKDQTATILIIVIPIILLILLVVCCLYWRSKRKQRLLKASMTALQKKVEEKKKIDGELLDIDKQVGDAKRRQESLILRRAQLQGLPDTWSDTDEILVSVNPDDEQYWTVLQRMRETMNDVHISKLWRVQNTSLWSYYSFHKDRLEGNGIPHNERRVWHGSSSLDPKIIYEDKMDGFMMQFAARGFWGRGLYFADKAVYCTHYSYRPPQATLASSFLSSSTGERPGGNADEKEMFLTKLLVGKDIFLDRDVSQAKANEYRNLTVPPTDTKTGLKYNTVSGRTAGSKVWVVYENGRAYPDYLVRYYRGERDPKRSPYASKPKTMKKSKVNSSASKVIGDVEMGLNIPVSTSTSSSTSSSGTTSASFVWEFRDNAGWKPYTASQQNNIEKHYQDYTSKKTKKSTVKVDSDEWSYEVDVARMVQTNTQHPGHRQRPVRRVDAI